MKKLFAIAFTCVYLLLTVGVIKNTHYCMGRINDTPAIHVVDKNSLTLDNNRNSAEFFILSDLYSEAFVIHLA